MLWGASLAVGAEAHHRFDNREQAMGLAMTTSRDMMNSFSNRTGSVDCREVSNCDFTGALGIAKCFLLGRFRTCFNLAEKWAPEAIRSANAGLSNTQDETSPCSACCAAEVAKKMGASKREMTMVSGFSGGLGLSGKACGALSAAVWMKSLAWHRQHSDSKPDKTEILKTFYRATESKIQCRDISGQCFKTVNDHSEYVKNGGCAELIDKLAQI